MAGHLLAPGIPELSDVKTLESPSGSRMTGLRICSFFQTQIDSLKKQDSHDGATFQKQLFRQLWRDTQM
ncbi:hypothetical protein [Chryseobacterium rhizoplanae]|uniref:hypothetical protein n=1 Tax=Chryseobacterium rhizoplanae TaxID=1609531 RepID=UPI001158CA38|nr:hypothetical protein [Chryseobacterium rhizoplanae]